MNQSNPLPVNLVYVISSQKEVNIMSRLKTWVGAVAIALTLIFTGCSTHVSFTKGNEVYVSAYDPKVIAKTKQSVLWLTSAARQGSGVVIGKRTILTANHVVQSLESVPEATLVIIKDSKGNDYKGEVTFLDKEHDLAIVNVFEKDLEAPPITISTGFSVGDPIFSAGYPLQGFEESEWVPEEDRINGPVCRIGFGTISDIRKTMVYADIGTYGFGVSGGGLFDANGGLIGIASMLHFDGVGKFAVARLPGELPGDLNFQKAPVPNKKRREFGAIEKIAALSERVKKGKLIGYDGRTYAPIYQDDLIWISGWPKDDDPEWRKYLHSNYDRPEKMWAKIQYNRGYLYIYWVAYWEHDRGYEKWSNTYQYLSFKEEYWLTWAYGIYWVADTYGIIMNMHGPGNAWGKQLSLDEVAPKAKWWLNFAFDQMIGQHIPPEEEIYNQIEFKGEYKCL